MRNKGKIIQAVVGISASVMLLSGCGSKRNAQGTEKIAESKSADSGQIVRVEKDSYFGKMVMHSLDDKAFEKSLWRDRGVDPEPISIAANHNTVAYLISSQEKGSEKVVLRPRVFIRSSPNQERIRPTKDGEGETQFNLLLAFVDGREASVSSGLGAVQIPNEYLLTEKESLLSELEKSLGKKPEFVESVNCPTQVRIHSRYDGEFPIQFRSLLKSCPMNLFFPVQLTVSERDWKALRESFVSEDNLEVRTSFALSLPIARSKMEFSLKTEAINERLKAIVGIGTVKPQSRY